MRPEQLASFKRQLEAKKNGLSQTISKLEDNALSSAMASEVSAYDNHPADLGSEMFERSKDLGLKDNEQILLSSVERALEKIHRGTYGHCDHCGATIPSERLEVLPWATQCIECQKNEDQTDVTPRPLEEELLKPPFHRSFLDSDEFESVGYDGEDTLQDVLQYGSSDTPQDIPGCHDYKDLFPNSNENQGIVDPADAILDQPDNTRQDVKNNREHKR